MRDSKHRARHVNEEAAHAFCPAEGFSVPAVLRSEPGDDADIAFIADNQYLVHRFNKLLKHMFNRNPDLLVRAPLWVAQISWQRGNVASSST